MVKTTQVKTRKKMMENQPQQRQISVELPKKIEGIYTIWRSYDFAARIYYRFCPRHAGRNNAKVYSPIIMTPPRQNAFIKTLKKISKVETIGQIKSLARKKNIGLNR
jgi:hypothetical protein